MYGVKPPSQTLTIGRLASAAGVNLETVRFYQRSGLIHEPQRPQGGYRTYGSGDVQRIRFIKRAQTLGFTLEEIATLLQLDEATACSETRQLASRKLGMVQARLEDLRKMQSALAEMIHQCDTPQADGRCPIITALTGD